MMKLLNGFFGVCLGVFVAAMASLGVASADPSAFYLHDGDHVVMYGDSITDQRLYTVFTEAYVTTRFPTMKVDWTDSGWGGDRVGGGGGGPIDLRLQRDVLAYKPSVVTIMLGMNDGNYKAFDQTTMDTYTKGYQHIIDTLQKGDPGVRITAIQPSAYDDVTVPPSFPGGYNAILVDFSNYIATIAPKDNLNVADFNTPMVTVLQAAKASDPTLASGIIPGRVHPSPAGHLIMTEALLKSWNAPSLVSAVAIDASASKTTSSSNATVSNLSTANGVAWDELDGSLPFPYNQADPVTAVVLKDSDFIAALNQETLQVTNLPAGQYDLTIDKAKVGTFTSGQLSTGINLATYNTPMMAQALQVLQLTAAHNSLHFAEWRNLQVPFASYTDPAIQKECANFIQLMNAKEQAIVDQQRAAAQPVIHHFTLTPAMTK